jgi:hypothetical protein
MKSKALIKEIESMFDYVLIAFVKFYLEHHSRVHLLIVEAVSLLMFLEDIQ